MNKEYYTHVEEGAYKLARLVIRVCLFYSYLFAAITFDLVALVFCKFWFGRLRPHFIDVCKPDVDDCDAGEYVVDYECTGRFRNRITNARMSFFSGHTSVTAATFIYLCIYTQNRLSGQIKNKFIVPLIYLLLIGSTLWIGYSRIAEFKHHFTDVLVGFLVGLLTAIFCAHRAGLKLIPNFLANWQKSDTEDSANV
ncbi:AcidPPc domain-containing protein [Aphelenchoides bicaudatus]|nr:AcidPPc domain-containing protein [Aphelenchoides bicaudatus]